MIKIIKIICSYIKYIIYCQVYDERWYIFYLNSIKCMKFIKGNYIRGKCNVMKLKELQVEFIFYI